MARIQVLPLTTERVGSVECTPFVIVIDRVGERDLESLASVAMEPERLAADLGATMVLVYDGELTVENIDPELQRLAQESVERALEARDHYVIG